MLDDDSQAFWMLRSAARKLDIDLSAALAEGRLSASGYARAVRTCRRCCCQAECQAWLGNGQADARDAPARCRALQTLHSVQMKPAH